MDQQILDQLEEWTACEDGIEYMASHATVQEAWQACQRGDWMMWWAQHCGVEKKVLLFCAVKQARLAQHLMTDQRSIKALDVAEAYAHGQATLDELRRAHIEAGSVYSAYVGTYSTDGASPVAACVAACVTDGVTDGVARAVAQAVAYECYAYRPWDYAQAAAKILAQCADICRSLIDVEDIACQIK